MHPVLHESLSRSSVMPVLVIPEISMAAPLAEALASGGLTVFEITLRTECALDAMIVMRDTVPEALIGAGTVTNADRIRQANDFGADFVVSPGTTQMLLNASMSINYDPSRIFKCIRSGVDGIRESLRQILPSRDIGWCELFNVTRRSTSIFSVLTEVETATIILRV